LHAASASRSTASTSMAGALRNPRTNRPAAARITDLRATATSLDIAPALGHRPLRTDPRRRMASTGHFSSAAHGLAQARPLADEVPTSAPGTDLNSTTYDPGCVVSRLPYGVVRIVATLSYASAVTRRLNDAERAHVRQADRVRGDEC